MNSRLAVCAAGVAIASMASMASANFLTNPGFEADDASGGDVSPITAWPGFNDHFATSSVARTGNNSLKLFGPFFNGGGAGVTQTVPAAAGQTWVAEAFSRNDSSDPIGTGNFLAMKIEFLDSGFGPVGGSFSLGVNVFEVIMADETSPLDSWEFAGLGTAPAPAGTAFANLVFVHVQLDPITGGSVFVDDASLIPAPGAASLLGIGGLALARRRRRVA